MRLVRFAFAVAAASVACAFQPSQLPPGYYAHVEAPEALWQVLAGAKVTADTVSGVWRATFPDAVKGYDGASIKISGFFLPLESAVKPRHFALTRRNGSCPFCPPNEPSEVIEVTAVDAITPTPNDLITVEGKLHLVAESSKGLFYRIDGAVKK